MKSDTVLRLLTLAAALLSLGLAIYAYYQTPSMEYQREMAKTQADIARLDREIKDKQKEVEAKLDRADQELARLQADIFAVKSGSIKGLADIRRTIDEIRKDNADLDRLTAAQWDAMLRQLLADYEAAKGK